MTDGGGDAPPPTAETGGNFLLQLLQKRRHHHHQPQAPPPPPHHLFDTSSRAPPAQSLADDPAVAAFGPSLNFLPPRASNVHDLSPPPHGLDNTLSPPPPYQPHFTGFPQNPPWSVPPGFPFNNGPNMPRAPQLPLNHRLNGEDDLGKLGFSRTDCRGNPVNRSEHKLMFGSFSSEIRTQEGSSNRNASLGADRDGLLPKFNMSKEGEVSVGNGSFNEQVRNRQFDLGPQNLNAFGQSGSGYRQHQEKFSRQPPPGFTNKPPGFPNRPREMGNWDSSGHRKGLEHRKMHGDSVELGLSEQIDRPGVPSDSVSDVEESLMDLHSEQIAIGDGPSRGIRDRTRRNVGGRASHQFDDLSEHFNDSLGLDDGLDGRNDWGRATSSRRDRDVRSDIRGQRLISQKMRNIKRYMKCRRDIDGLNTSFLAIYKSLTPSEEEKAKQELLLTLLEKLVCEEWPNARLYLYGSCANSFGVSKSDIDVCLAIEGADVEKSEVLLRLADILQSDNLQNVQALTRARVPIVKLMDPETGLSCDICINNVLAVVNTKLLRDYAEIDVRLRQLAFIVKHWAKTRGVNVTYQGTLSSYAYVIMCINFLQLRKPAILPCLQGMEATYSVTIDDVHYAFFDQVDELRDFGSANRESIAQLVWAFFNYWAYHHDYTNEVISIRTGSIISKRAKDWTRRVGNDRHLICIEDPFEVSHDLGRVVDKFSIRVLREEFERAAYIMQCDPNPCKTLFEPYIPC